MMDEQEMEKLDEIHAFFFQEHIKGQPSRAQQIDEVLMAVRTGRNAFRAVAWMLGGVALIGAAWKYVMDIVR